MAATDAPRLQAVLTVTVDAEGDYYVDHADLIAHVVPWIEGGLDDRDDIRNVTITEQAAGDRAAILREAIDVAREEGHRLEAASGIEAARGARSVAYLLRKLLVKAQPFTAAELEAAAADVAATVEAEFELRGTAQIRAAVFREAAEVVYGMDTDPSTEAAAAALRRMADEAQAAKVDEISTPLRRRLTPDEYSAAWHAVEGSAGEDGADPATILNAVLGRLGIDGPERADEAHPPKTQAHPPETYWQIETQWHTGDWRSWAIRTEHDDAVREFATVKDGTHAWRLVRFDTAAVIEAEHAAPQPGDAEDEVTR